jgi:hypothetical protein
MTSFSSAQRSCGHRGVPKGLRWFGVSLALVLVATPVQAAFGSFETTDASGRGLEATGQGVLDIHAGSVTGASLNLGGGVAHIAIVDEMTEDAVRFPLDPEADIPPIYGSSMRYESSIDLVNFTIDLDSIQDEDARTLVFTDRRSTMEVALDGRYQVDDAPSRVIESSHTLERNDTFPPWSYYEYRTPAALEIASSEGAEVLAQGDFEVYVWGQTLSYVDAAGEGEVRTGHWMEASNGNLGQFDFVRDEHFQYAVISVIDGILQYTQASGPINLFSGSIDAAPAGVSYRSASGSISLPTGRLNFNNDFLRVEGGSYHWTLAYDGVGVTVLKAPTTATATNGVFAAHDAASLPDWIFPVAGLAALALVLIAYLYPTMRGGQTVPTGSGWNARRADGYASMAASAETAGWHRMAAFWMAWSLRVVPADPLRMVDLAILRARIGRHQDAMLLHETAHGWLADTAHGEHVAHNAYEAAKTAAQLDRQSEALDWMRMALEADPGLHSRIGREPAFAKLRDAPDYASLTVGGA